MGRVSVEVQLVPGITEALRKFVELAEEYVQTWYEQDLYYPEGRDEWEVFV